jgi:putative membrane protein
VASDFTPALRLHPLSWLFVLVASVRQFIVPVIAVVFFGARDDGSMWGVLIVIPLVIAAVWRQVLFRYGFGPRGLVIRDGLLFRNVRQIEYARIENIDTQRGILHRLLQVAEVRVESSTGGKPEAVIRVLALPAVAELRARVFDRGQPTRVATHAAESQLLLRLSPMELMRFGFIDNRGMLIVAAAFGVFSQTGAMNRLVEWVGAGILKGDLAQSNLALLAVGAGALVALLLIVRLLSLVWALVTLHDFTLTRSAQDLRARYGLLTRVALTVRLPRVQAVHQTETLMHRFFDRVSLSADFAGDGIGGQTDEQGTPQLRMRWLAPICTPSHSTQLMRVALPMLTGDSEVSWQPLAPGARARLFRKTVLVWSLILLPPAAYLWQWAAPLVWAVILPVSGLHAIQYVRHTRWALTSEALWFRRGWLTRRLSVIPRDRIQAIQEVASPFDRRKAMAALIVDTAGASSPASVVRIPYLHAAIASEAARQLYVSVRDLTFRHGHSASVL